MSILDSTVAPVLFLVAGLGVLAGFFRKTLITFIIFMAVQVLFLALFPKVLVAFVNLVTRVSEVIR